MVSFVEFFFVRKHAHTALATTTVTAAHLTTPTFTKMIPFQAGCGNEVRFSSPSPCSPSSSCSSCSSSSPSRHFLASSIILFSFLRDSNFVFAFCYFFPAGDVVKTWKKRFFKQTGSRLYYSESETTLPKYFIDLATIDKVRGEEKENERGVRKNHKRHGGEGT